MKNEIILLDGAVGTSLWEKAENKVPVWRYNLENPAIVAELHEEYVAAGAQVILANTFGANGGAVAQSPYSVPEVVRTGVKIAKEAVRGRAAVALSAGPLMGLLEPYGEISAEEAERLYEEMLGSGMMEGPDLIYLQTFMDAEMMHIALKVANRFSVPVFCSMSFEKNGYTMMGNSVEAVVELLSDCRVDTIGLNCSLEPAAALPVVAEFRKYTQLPIIFKPNAGKPISAGDDFHSGTDRDTFVHDILPAIDAGVTYIGGCCGTNASYIAALHQALEVAYPGRLGAYLH